MQNSLYEGWVRHRRHAPQPHAFRYRLFMVCLNLDELDSAFKGRWLWSARRANLAWFRRSDHLGPRTQPLKASVLDLVQAQRGFRPRGPVFIVTHLRYFGHGFNPVSFYYCLDEDGEKVEAIVAEINNTPWGEQFSYVLDARPQDGKRVHVFRMQKTFHVSPFMPLAQAYDWRFTRPQNYLLVHMTSEESGTPVFDATLNLERKPMNAWNMARVLLQYPLMTVKVIGAIYWQAFRLWLKRTPFHPHPDKISKEALS